MLTSGPRGTKDILPDSSGYWQYIEQVIREVCHNFAYQEIRTPIFEHTELFLRGIGETTDIVEKEMYTFTDRGKRSITLRPENTAAVVRSYLEHKLYAGPQPTKLYYIGPMFRYDRPQAGRYRQFHQFGVEALSAPGPAIDAEIISLAVEFLNKLGLNDLKLLINSVGCPACRPVYRSRLQEFFRDKLSHVCPDCQSRYDRNPMRILDCKNEACTVQSQGAPHMADCLCEECGSHFTGLQALLTAAGISFVLNPRLVRGLDYYTKTAFEIQYAPLGAQSAVCGGGRYDGLIAECGGQPTPGIGFAIGMERVLLALEKQELLPSVTNAIEVFVAPLGQETQAAAFEILTELRRAGIAADMDFMNRSLKAQMKYANKYPARFVALIGEDELAQNKVMLKNMEAGSQELIDKADLISMITEGMEK
ncbi:histidine--tRNA ligase [Sporomusa sphaeroides]|uniref:Histidine--tRNA ligase n=1 Tax=Sporomusa sphaeroides DSM 2875 TaxID=1337886 RepID=A0ABP2C680_9FIRM|nr:histidine--tRNA ligase [Sporomusa sphaeroides]OLS58465.1 histidine--tRNA ligase [Sporomusa sphaeroides DSM 2875]CVK19605.1 Histidine--tRNA ligase [Sporomusa sphaeroides DSM 2875]